jgi:hypothetical protein
MVSGHIAHVKIGFPRFVHLLSGGDGVPPVRNNPGIEARDDNASKPAKGGAQVLREAASIAPSSTRLLILVSITADFLTDRCVKNGPCEVFD